MTRGRTSTATAVALAAAALGFGAAPASACPGENAEASGITAKRYEASVLCLINRERAKARAGAVRTDARLRRAAAKHNRAMVTSHFFAHRDPKGADPFDRIAATGYTAGAKRWSAAENIGWGAGPGSSPAAIVSAWLRSPPHRATMLDPAYADIGIGVNMAAPVNSSPPGPVTITTDYGFRRG